MILVTEFMDAHAVRRLSEEHRVVHQPDLADRPGDLEQLVAEASALIVRNRTRVTEQVLARAPDLRCIGRLGVGLDNIDMEACDERGIAVYPATGANNLAVAEYVITTAAMLLRGAYFAMPEMLAGQWPRERSAGREIAGKLLGLVGFGAIARDTARLARGFGMSVAAHDPFVATGDPAWADVANCGLAELLAKADVVSLHVPLTAQTRHLISAEELASMKWNGILINASRGGVIDELALCEALSSGQIAGAALDVFEAEPLTAEAAARFRGVSRLVLTPHVAGVTEESNIRVSAAIADAVLTHLARG